MDAETGAPKDELNQEAKAWLKGIGLQYSTLSEIIRAGPCEKVCEFVFHQISSWLIWIFYDPLGPEID